MFPNQPISPAPYQEYYTYPPLHLEIIVARPSAPTGFFGRKASREARIFFSWANPLPTHP